MTRGKRLILVVAVFAMVCLSCSGCAFVSPERSKAMTEEEQLKVMRVENDLLREQNEKLERIATALESLAAK